MIGLDTNILARFYVDDPGDPEAAKQRPIARRVIAESPALFVPLTVILELEWVLRAFYGFERSDFIRVVEHLMGLPNVTVFATVRLRTDKTRGCVSRESILAMVFKRVKSAERHWRKLNGIPRLAQVIERVIFKDRVRENVEKIAA
jgi:predicted nucleic acid-binding protein